jgi:hypothetical protein
LQLFERPGSSQFISLRFLELATLLSSTLSLRPSSLLLLLLL